MSLENTWVGAAMKYGGTFLLVGAETLHGGIIRCSEPRTIWGIEAGPGLRLGLGLGGGAQLQLIILLNTPNPHRSDLSDWGVDFSLGARWSSVVGALSPMIKNHETYTRVCSLALRLSSMKATPRAVQLFRDFGHTVQNLYNTLAAGNDPVAIVQDIPAAGWGVGAGVTYTFSGRVNLFGPPVRV